MLREKGKAFLPGPRLLSAPKVALKSIFQNKKRVEAALLAIFLYRHVNLEPDILSYGLDVIVGLGISTQGKNRSEEQIQKDLS